MPKITNEKSGKSYYECWYCEDHPRLERREVVCFRCDKPDLDALAERKKLKELSKKQRMKRVEKEFTEEFDTKILNFALYILKSLKNPTIRDLVDIFIEEGLFDGMEAKFRDESTGRETFSPWAVAYVVKLAKLWHKAEKVFIGTRQTKGHPYAIYLPENVEAQMIQDMKMHEDPLSEKADIMMSFGKYKGQMISWIASEEPTYIKWLVEKATLRENSLKVVIESYYYKIIKPKIG